MIVARTEKGHGVSFVANHEGWHGKAMSSEQAAQAIEELGGIRSLTITPPSPPDVKPLTLGAAAAAPPPAYTEPIPTRKAFGEALAWLAGHRADLVVLDGEVGNSTHTEDFQAVAPERFVEMYIAEQAMIGAQTGLQALGKTAFAATFGAFLTRACDQVRMGAISRADLRLCGSHAGVSIGEDGPSQMALEDLAMFRALHGSIVLYPADGAATVRLVAAMCDLPGISYMRTTREATPVVYDADEEFPIGGSKTLRSGHGDVATIVGAGVTVRESLAAADALAAEGIAVRVIDAYSVKPIDAATLRRALEETGAIVVAEDHRVEGGSATRCSRRWPRPARSLARWSSSASATCQAPERRRRCGPGRGSTRPRSRPACATRSPDRDERPPCGQARSALVTFVAAPGTPPKA